jgi:hypothetical protein
MMTRYLSDMVFMVMAAIAAFFLAGMPKYQNAPVPRPVPVSAEVRTSPEVKLMEAAPKLSGKAIGKRNIFVSSGSYKDSVKTAAIPDNPYILLGIVQEGSVMKAIFREYTGSITKTASGQRMIDGFQVATVQNRQVMLKKGNERKVFSVYGASLESTSGQGDIKKNSDFNPLLIGILEGADKKAVFKDASGNFTILETGRSLPDGSVIAQIDSSSVILRNGKDKKDLTLYAQAFPKEPVGTVKFLPHDKSSSSPVPARRRPNHPKHKVDEPGQGGSQ